MRVLALYTTKTLSLVRRVMAPFSVLNTRGYSFSFLQTANFDADLSYGYEVTVLNNWVLTFEERDNLCQVMQQSYTPRSFIYDLSDPALLEDERVRETLKLVTGVTVPNEVLAKRVRSITSHVRVLPSVVDVPYFVQGRKVKPVDDHPVVGCFGPHDWYLVKDAIQVVKEKHPRVEFIGDDGAAEALGTDLVTHTNFNTETYPGLLNLCWCGLCPLEGRNSGYDTVWADEYGILGKPVIVAGGSPYTQGLCVSSLEDTSSWVKSLEKMLFHGKDRAQRGNEAFRQANLHRSTLLAGAYRTIYEAMLPHLVHR